MLQRCWLSQAKDQKKIKRSCKVWEIFGSNRKKTFKMHSSFFFLLLLGLRQFQNSFQGLDDFFSLSPSRFSIWGSLSTYIMSSKVKLHTVFFVVLSSSTGWILSTIKLLHCSLTKQWNAVNKSQQHQEKNSWRENFFGTLRIKPGAAGHKARMLSIVLCGPQFKKLFAFIGRETNPALIYALILILFWLSVPVYGVFN